jgi:hypothetical protein
MQQLILYFRSEIKNEIKKLVTESVLSYRTQQLVVPRWYHTNIILWHGTRFVYQLNGASSSAYTRLLR